MPEVCAPYFYLWDMRGGVSHSHLRLVCLGNAQELLYVNTRSVRLDAEQVAAAIDNVAAAINDMRT